MVQCSSPRGGGDEVHRLVPFELVNVSSSRSERLPELGCWGSCREAISVLRPDAGVLSPANHSLFPAVFNLLKGGDMSKWQKLFLGAALLALACVPGWGQGAAPPPLPIPVPGGDVLPNPDGSTALWNSFVPGVGAFLDGQNAEPNIITNFKGWVAMGYTLGTATDNKGNRYAVITDIRVYRGDYVGGVPTYMGGGTTSAKGHGTFVLI